MYTEKDDFIIGTNQGKTNAIFVKKVIDYYCKLIISHSSK